MSAGPGQSAPRPALYRDLRDLAPFRTPVIRTPVRGLAEGVGGAVSGILAGRARGALPVEGGAPRLGKVGGRAPGKAAKAVHAAIFGSSDPNRLIALAHQRWVIEQFYDQQKGVPVATIPLFQLDMWEHAFYLDYQNVKADYVKAIWNIVNWADVQARFDAARAAGTGLVIPSA